MKYCLLISSAFSALQYHLAYLMRSTRSVQRLEARHYCLTYLVRSTRRVQWTAGCITIFSMYTQGYYSAGDRLHRSIKR